MGRGAITGHGHSSWASKPAHSDEIDAIVAKRPAAGLTEKKLTTAQGNEPASAH
jgi:hypothetical protein